VSRLIEVRSHLTKLPKFLSLQERLLFRNAKRIRNESKKGKSFKSKHVTGPTIRAAVSSRPVKEETDEVSVGCRIIICSNYNLRMSCGMSIDFKPTPPDRQSQPKRKSPVSLPVDNSREKARAYGNHKEAPRQKGRQLAD
jgi:hypothetical protein